MMNPSLHLECAALHFSHVHTAHFSQHTDITLKEVPNREYTLRLFVENVERELERKNNLTWTPAQHQYVPYFVANTYTHWCMCICRDVFLTSHIRTKVFFFFAPSWKCCNGISRGSNHSVPTAVTLTNDPGSLELSCGLHRGKRFMAAIAVGAPGL